MADYGTEAAAAPAILQKEPRLRVSLGSLPQSRALCSFSVWMFTWPPSQCDVAVGIVFVFLGIIQCFLPCFCVRNRDVGR